MAQAEFSRRAFFGALWREGLWGRWIAFAVAVLGAMSSAVTFAPTLAPDLAPILSKVPFASWVLALLSVLLVWCFEASYRSLRKSEMQVRAFELKLASPIHRQRELLAEHIVDARTKLVGIAIDARETATDSSQTARRYDLLSSGEKLAAQFTHDSEFSRLWHGFKWSFYEIELAKLNRLSKPQATGWKAIIEHVTAPTDAEDRMRSACGSLVSWLMMHEES
jgi:hypothetical protein